MEINQIKSIEDAVTFFIEHPQYTEPGDDTVLLQAKYRNASDDEFRWDIWDRTQEQSSKYPFLEGGPNLMYYRQKTVDKKPYTAGIAFPLKLGSNNIQKATAEGDNLYIWVTDRAFYWAYDRTSNLSQRDEFSAFNANDYTIDPSAQPTPQMDSSSPSHPGHSSVSG